ncbi:hypothetical protein ACQEUU_37780 [Nonomuraea sp. CA-218870]|uniref:hypothetical protein n=1 Tax=Nonomuraea sp. CA-218870 TaxID=3239998 RepID=UPI003D90462C
MNPIDDLIAVYQAVPLHWRVGALALIGLAVLVATLVIGWRVYQAVSERVKRTPIEDTLTIVGATIATGVSATGMWKFTGDVLDLWWPLRIVLFAFIEVAVVTSAVRARRSMRENYSAGVDGIAVWVLAGLTAVLSSLDAASFGEAAFRLASPLVAAWLWERGMRLERRRMRGMTGINWRLTPERILVRLGLAEATDRTAGDVDAHRRLTRVALAIKKVRALQQANAPARKVQKALAKLDKAMDAAVEYASLAVDEARQEALLAQIDTLYSTGVLVKREKVPAWADPVSERQRAEAAAAVDELRRLNAAEATQRALDNAALKLMSLTPDVTPELINSGVNSKVNNQVNNGPAQTPENGSKLSPELTSRLTPEVTIERVNNPINFDVNNAAAYDLGRMLSADPYMTSPLTPELTPGGVNNEVNDDAESAPKTQVMKDLWDAEVAEDRYPSVTELARHAGADVSLASRKRKEWVAELPWRQRRKADPPKKVTA